jgi:hypothetical protein
MLPNRLIKAFTAILLFCFLATSAAAEVLSLDQTAYKTTDLILVIC